MKDTYTFHTDPGHGWLAVPIEDVTESGIEPTRCSFHNPASSTVFLEEDIDAPAFLAARAAAGHPAPTITERYHHSRPSFTTLPRWGDTPRRRPAYAYGSFGLVNGSDQ